VRGFGSSGFRRAFDDGTPGQLQHAAGAFDVGYRYGLLGVGAGVTNELRTWGNQVGNLQDIQLYLHAGLIGLWFDSGGISPAELPRVLQEVLCE
jgi:hypothetical protein